MAQPGTSGERVLSVSGKKRCSHCKEELGRNLKKNILRFGFSRFITIFMHLSGRGAAMIIESLRLYYHLKCFQCCVCHIQLGNGSTGTDVRVRNNKLHCQNCYSNDEGKKSVPKQYELIFIIVKCLIFAGLKFSKV